MLHVCAVRFDMIGNLEKFLDFEVTKQGPSDYTMIDHSLELTRAVGAEPAGRPMAVHACQR